jgi:hypothetical protein
MVYSIEIINKNSDIFRLQEGECKNASYNLITKLFKQTLPDGKPEDAIVINFGREINVSCPFILRVTTDDAAAGTYTGHTVKTVQEKLDYLLNVFITDKVEDFYTINIYASPANILNKKCILESLTFDFSSDKPNVLQGSLGVSIGGGKQ